MGNVYKIYSAGLRRARFTSERTRLDSKRRVLLALVGRVLRRFLGSTIASDTNVFSFSTQARRLASCVR